MINLRKKRKGIAVLLSLVLSSIVMMFVATGLATVYSSQLNVNDSSKIANQTLQYADIKANELRNIAYSTIATKAEARTAIANTKYEREVLIGSETDLGNGNKQRIATVNIYKTGETLSRQSVSVPLSSLGSGNLPQGSIILWSGYISAIPSGFQLCNGTNGSPDLRNRFVVGAGSDAGGHIPNGVGWNNLSSGYFAPGNWGGEEMHRLTLAEMPSHNHTLSAGIDTGDAGKGSYKFLSKSIAGAEPLDSSGGDQAHNIMPPYYSLAYIIKL